MTVNPRAVTRKAKRAVPTLWTVFDTNAVYTGSASYLLRKEIADLIRENSAHVDLRTRWIIPEVVKHERQFQMNRKALALLPSVEKLERLLGHNLNITPDILKTRVNEAVERQERELGLEVAKIDQAKTDWQRIMLDSAYRNAPFDAGETEKGFRDALVLESFAQLKEVIPSDPKSGRLVLVTGDGRLLEAAQARFQGVANVRLFPNVDELRGLINTLVSTVDEEFVRQLTPMAQKLFFVPKDESTLYYTQRIASTIRERFRAEIGNLPGSGDSVEIMATSIHQPQFVKKDRQNVHWSSRIESKLEVKKKPQWNIGDALASYYPSGSALQPLGTAWLPAVASKTPIDFSKVTISGSPSGSANPDLLAGLFGPPSVAAGKMVHEVSWHSVVSTARKLTRPQVESIEFVEVSWE